MDESVGGNVPFDLTAAAGALERGELSSVEITDRALERIEPVLREN